MSEQDFRYPLLSAKKDNLPPLIISSLSHPAYQPIKLNIKTAHDMKLNKTKIPEKPLAPYMRYSKKVWDQVKTAHPDAKLWEIGRIIGQMWRDTSDNEKQEYINEYENAKSDYCEQLKIYHNSPQYQNFLSNASKVKKFLGQNSINNTNVLNNVNILNQINNNSNGNTNAISSIPGKDSLTTYSTSLSHYAIESAEDDGIDDDLSSKNLASNRYLRNHRLLNEIFTEYCVQDNRSIVTMQRMDQLKKQVNSLEQHQEKLKQELQTIEDKYENKKRKFLKNSFDFDNELKKLKDFKVNDEQNSHFFSKHYELIQKQWKEFNENFLTSLQTKTISKEVANNFLRDGLENLILANNNNKNSMSINNPSIVTIVALQQALETNPNSTNCSLNSSNIASQSQTNLQNTQSSSCLLANQTSTNSQNEQNTNQNQLLNSSNINNTQTHSNQINPPQSNDFINNSLHLNQNYQIQNSPQLQLNNQQRLNLPYISSQNQQQNNLNSRYQSQVQPNSSLLNVNRGGSLTSTPNSSQNSYIGPNTHFNSNNQNFRSTNTPPTNLTNNNIVLSPSQSVTSQVNNIAFNNHPNQIQTSAINRIQQQSSQQQIQQQQQQQQQLRQPSNPQIQANNTTQQPQQPINHSTHQNNLINPNMNMHNYYNQTNIQMNPGQTQAHMNMYIINSQNMQSSHQPYPQPNHFTNQQQMQQQFGSTIPHQQIINQQNPMVYQQQIPTQYNSIFQQPTNMINNQNPNINTNNHSQSSGPSQNTIQSPSTNESKTTKQKKKTKNSKSSLSNE